MIKIAVNWPGCGSKKPFTAIQNQNKTYVPKQKVLFVYRGWHIIKHLILPLETKLDLYQWIFGYWFFLNLFWFCTVKPVFVLHTGMKMERWPQESWLHVWSLRSQHLYFASGRGRRLCKALLLPLAPFSLTANSLFLPVKFSNSLPEKLGRKQAPLSPHQIFTMLWRRKPSWLGAERPKPAYCSISLPDSREEEMKWILFKIYLSHYSTVVLHISNLVVAMTSYIAWIGGFPETNKQHANYFSSLLF